MTWSDSHPGIDRPILILPRLVRSLLIITACLSTTGVIAQKVDPPDYFDPARFEEAILAFEKIDSALGFQQGAVVFYGSSSIRMWHDSLAGDLAPLPVVGRGFGGSTLIDAINYADRVVIPHKPRAIVLYEGDNDIGSFGFSPERVAELFDDFAQKIRSALPETDIYFISIKPSPSRWNHWPQMNSANEMIRARCNDSPRLHYLDVANAMLEEGRPKEDLFLNDMLHMNAEGYSIWRDIVKDALLGNR